MTYPQAGEQYRHYKSLGGSDHTYEVIGLGQDSNTQEILIIYKPLCMSSLEKNSNFWVRSLQERNTEVFFEDSYTKRFTKIL